jgi:hypothetical protein
MRLFQKRMLSGRPSRSLGHEALQLFVVRQVDDAEAAFSQDSLHPVATDVAWRGRGSIGPTGFPSGFVHGLVGVVHGPLPSSPVPFRQDGL